MYAFETKYSYMVFVVFFIHVARLIGSAMFLFLGLLLLPRAATCSPYAYSIDSASLFNITTQLLKSTPSHSFPAFYMFEILFDFVAVFVAAVVRILTRIPKNSTCTPPNEELTTAPCTSSSSSTTTRNMSIQVVSISRVFFHVISKGA